VGSGVQGVITGEEEVEVEGVWVPGTENPVLDGVAQEERERTKTRIRESAVNPFPLVTRFLTIFVHSSFRDISKSIKAKILEKWRKFL
jgi:hypothetical protein